MGWVKDEVTNLIDKFKTNNPFELAALMKIHVTFLDLHEEILGFYRYNKRNKFIILNRQANKLTQKFLCGHELGHAVLHPNSNTPFLRAKTLFSVEKIEVQANTFAVEMLITDEIMNQYTHTSHTIKDICNIYGVPEQLSYLKNFG